VGSEVADIDKELILVSFKPWPMAD